MSCGSRRGTRFAIDHLGASRHDGVPFQHDISGESAMRPRASSVFLSPSCRLYTRAEFCVVRRSRSAISSRTRYSRAPVQQTVGPQPSDHRRPCVRHRQGYALDAHRLWQAEDQGWLGRRERRFVGRRGEWHANPLRVSDRDPRATLNAAATASQSLARSAVPLCAPGVVCLTSRSHRACGSSHARSPIGSAGLTLGPGRATLASR
jgi:hypothetical protein